MNIIVAHANNYCIGGNNTLLWHIPEDLRRFKELTLNKVVVMGYNTWLSLPEKFRPLPNRTNIILSDIERDIEGAHVVTSISSLIELLLTEGYNKEDVFIIGGASIYKQFINNVDRLFITKVNIDIDGDAFFPESYESDFTIIAKEDCSDENYDYSFCVYMANNLLS